MKRRGKTMRPLHCWAVVHKKTGEAIRATLSRRAARVRRNEQLMPEAYRVAKAIMLEVRA